MNKEKKISKTQKQKEKVNAEQWWAWFYFQRKKVLSRWTWGSWESSSGSLESCVPADEMLCLSFHVGKVRTVSLAQPSGENARVDWVRSTGLVVQKALEGILAEEPANRCYWDHWSIWFQGRDYRVMKGSQVMMLVCRMRPGRLSKSENPEPRGRIIEFFSRSGTCAFVILMSSSSAFWCKPSKLVNGGPGCRTPTGGATHLGDSAKGSGWSCAVPSLGTQAWPCDNQAPWKLPEMPLDPLLTEEGPWAPAVH